VDQAETNETSYRCGSIFSAISLITLQGAYVGTEDRLESRVGYQLKRAEHALRLEMDGALRDMGLTTPQYAALSVLGDEPGLSGAELARRCFVTPQTIMEAEADKIAADAPGE
jgi:hypothetical protein